MAARRVTTVTCADDMHRLKGYKSLKEFIDHIESQTDLELMVSVDEDCVSVWQESSQAMSFTYPSMESTC